jgi:hypothetical protein
VSNPGGRAPHGGSGAVGPRDLGLSSRAPRSGSGRMGRRKMSAAAPPSRSWSNVGGSVISGEIRGLGLMRVVALRCRGSKLARLCFYGLCNWWGRGIGMLRSGIRGFIGVCTVMLVLGTTVICLRIQTRITALCVHYIPRRIFCAIAFQRARRFNLKFMFDEELCY